MNLVIDTNSWHYQYFLAIRKLFGFTEAPKQSSLCPYVQTIIWLSVFAVVLLPFALTGWVLVKAFRWAYKRLLTNKFGRFALNILDKIKFGDFLENAPDMFPHSVYMSFVYSGFGSCAYLAAVCVFLSFCALPIFLIYLLAEAALSGSLFTTGYDVVSAVLGFLWKAVVNVPLCVGWAFYMCCAAIGMVMHYLWVAICFVVMRGLLNADMWITVGHFLWSIALITAFCVGAAYVGYLIFKSKMSTQVWDFLVFKLNGFATAREKLLQERAEAKAIAAAAATTVEKSPCAICCKINDLVASISDAIHNFFLSSTKMVGGKVVKVMSPMAIVWAFIKAVKQRACPMVKFVDVTAAAKAEAVQEALQQVENNAGPTAVIPEYYDTSSEPPK